MARLAAVVSLMAALVVVQWPFSFGDVGYGKVLFLVAALTAWIGIEAADFQNHYGYNLSELNEDAAKLNNITKRMDRRTFYIVKNHAVETYIGSDDYRGLDDILAYHEEDVFPFHNDTLQKDYVDFCILCSDFLRELWTLYTIDGRGRATWKSPGEGWVSEEVYERVRGKVALLNSQSGAIADAWEIFVKKSKRELRGNTVGISGYDTPMATHKTTS